MMWSVLQALRNRDVTSLGGRLEEVKQTCRSLEHDLKCTGWYIPVNG
jgi:hypothetical protein